MQGTSLYDNLKAKASSTNGNATGFQNIKSDLESQQEKMKEKKKSNDKTLAYAQLVKFAFCDFPTQISLVYYLVGWYDRNGMRCQMCLFDLDHCQTSYAFHGVNLFSVLFILSSAILTSLLLLKFHRDKRRVYSEDEICIIRTLQFAAVSVATLPFSTGLLLISRDQLALPGVVHMLAAVPCMFGWLSISFLLCYPLLCMLDDEEFVSGQYSYGEYRYSSRY